MAIHAISADTSTTIDATTAAGDIWVVKDNVEVTTAGNAIDGTGSNGGKTFLIYGNLIAEADGIDLGNSVLNDGGNNRVLISSTGSIFAEGNAIESYGGGLDLTNEGSVFSVFVTIIAEMARTSSPTPAPSPHPAAVASLPTAAATPSATAELSRHFFPEFRRMAAPRRLPIPAPLPHPTALASMPPQATTPSAMAAPSPQAAMGFR